MPRTEHYEMLVLGSGIGGKLLAWNSAKAGRRTAVVERRYVGGSCPNINCLPTKNEIWSAKVADLVHHAERYGLLTGKVSIDMKRVRARKRAMVDDLVTAHLGLYKESGAELIMGTGRLVAPKTLEVELNDGGTRILAGDRMVLNLGTHAAMPDVPGLAAAQPMTNIETLELDRLPQHFIMIGGGYVGLEFAQAYRRFGSRVTLIEVGPQIVAREDPDVAAAVQELLRDEGVEVLLGAKNMRIAGRSGDSVSVTLQTAAGERTIEGSDLLIAAGRTPNTDGLGLDAAGVTLDARGYIQVNDRLETSAPDVWAVGESAGSPQFTHVSEDDFRIVWANLNGGNRSTKGRLVPYCMFTDPPLARVGLSESEARRQGIAYRVATLPVGLVHRARTTSETRGFMKALIEAKGERILGFTMLGADAGEVMAVVQTAMLAGMPYTGLRDAVLAHPTMAEGLGMLFAGVPAG